MMPPWRARLRKPSRRSASSPSSTTRISSGSGASAARGSSREGAAVTQQGEHGVGFFVIAEGNATVSIDDEVKTTLGPGDYFGEMALILKDGTRSATITAATAPR